MFTVFTVEELDEALRGAVPGARDQRRNRQAPHETYRLERFASPPPP
jgi:hypothetical protein